MRKGMGSEGEEVSRKGSSERKKKSGKMRKGRKEWGIQRWIVKKMKERK